MTYTYDMYRYFHIFPETFHLNFGAKCLKLRKIQNKCLLIVETRTRTLPSFSRRMEA